MELTDLQIKNGIKKKDEKIYDYIIGKYAKQSYFVAANILRGYGSIEDIEECSADAFFKAWETIDRFNPEKGRFKTWLLILTKYMALEYKRRLLKTNTVNIEDIPDKYLDDNVSEFVIERERQEQLVGIISGFNATDRELFVRRYFYGEKINELVESMNLSRSAIDNRLLRGRKIIKEALAYE